ncbi:hypothetical protein [Methylobacterium brachythecii]|uniref:Uncharacterized protein n=1 Tax=Methylobacterium brachythecii TaxID=1176177 RepID=A0A7W6AQJ4_9HYPH|nr:hypothetical protein [Methylobacterium brachythecii]MBB3905400.1 hypothetical protein [Methylobacterium brachythecii]GLS46743.1 hypothetical protein GCM10007884_47380 [Methylobacterium brachythecii]
MAHTIKRAGFTQFDDGLSAEAYAKETAPTYFDDPYQRADGPEECAEADISYWGGMTWTIHPPHANQHRGARGADQRAERLMLRRTGAVTEPVTGTSRRLAECDEVKKSEAGCPCTFGTDCA